MRSAPTNAGHAGVKILRRSNCGVSGSARELAFLGEWAEAEPDLDIGGELTVACQRDALRGARRSDIVQSKPDRRHGAQIGGDVEVDLEARIDRAQIDSVFRLDDQPPIP